MEEVDMKKVKEAIEKFRETWKKLPPEMKEKIKKTWERIPPKERRKILERLAEIGLALGISIPTGLGVFYGLIPALGGIAFPLSEVLAYSILSGLGAIPFKELAKRFERWGVEETKKGKLEEIV